ncbi:response regulator [Paenibacillus sp. sgz500958]|uniref:response regulator transcription factor n=1 Tax=Paenibacillus sp. sgz500958 TaxID=3242475 RepID=UPI0036D2847C
MFTILIVDDEKIERDGIRGLIAEMKYDLRVIEAENGEKALEYLHLNPVDILLTDIKMPFMGGLELAEQASLVQPSLEIIIYSAYGEFDYARRALYTNASSYLLKPIDMDEFAGVMSGVMQKCAHKATQQLRTAEIMQGYQKGLEYEKEKWLIDLLNGVTVISNVAELPFGGGPAALMLIDLKERFFDRNYEAFEQTVQQLAAGEYEVLNLNEYQSVLIVSCPVSGGQEEIREMSERLAERISEQWYRHCCIVYGPVVSDWHEISACYGQIEQTLDYKFFFEDTVVLFAGDDLAGRVPDNVSAEILIADINQFINHGEYAGASRSIELLFSHLSRNGSSSAIYIKYLCSDLVRNAFDQSGRRQKADFQQTVERIFKSDSIQDVKEVLLQALSEIEPDNGAPDESKRHIVQQVIRIVEKDFRDDISLEVIAGRVSLNPTYLSHLFKKETGQSLIKFITLQRLEQAQYLLGNTNMKIVDIAENVGYWSSSYFCLTFKKYYGISPQKYREMLDE